VNDLDFWNHPGIRGDAGQLAFGTNAFTSTSGHLGAKVDVANSPRAPNRVEFSSAAYHGHEATPGFATITVLNAGGAPGSIDYATSVGRPSATVDYEPVTGTIFAMARPRRTFLPHYDNAVVNPNKTVNLDRPSTGRCGPGLSEHRGPDDH